MPACRAPHLLSVDPIPPNPLSVAYAVLTPSKLRPNDATRVIALSKLLGACAMFRSSLHSLGYSNLPATPVPFDVSWPSDGTLTLAVPKAQRPTCIPGENLGDTDGKAFSSTQFRSSRRLSTLRHSVASGY